MKLKADKYYVYKYEDAKILTKTYLKEFEEDEDEIYANDIKLIEGFEDLSKDWYIQSSVEDEEIELIAEYDSLEDFENSKEAKIKQVFKSYYKIWTINTDEISYLVEIDDCKTAWAQNITLVDGKAKITDNQWDLQESLASENIAIQDEYKSLEEVEKALQRDKQIKEKLSTMSNKDSINVVSTKTISDLKDEFATATSLTLRVYKGKGFADDSATLSDVGCNQDGTVELSTRKKIKTIENEFGKLGIKVQIATADNSKLCNDDHTLAKAKENNSKIDTKDEKMEIKKDKCYVYKYNDTIILTGTYEKDGDILANDILKITGEEEPLDGWEIADMANKGNVEILAEYDSVVAYNANPYKLDNSEKPKENAEPTEWSDEKKAAIEKIKESNWSYTSLDSELKKDKDVVLAYLDNNGGFYNVDESLHGDKDVVLKGIGNNCYYNLKDEELAKDEDIQKTYVKAMQVSFKDNLAKALKEYTKQSNCIHLDKEIVKKYWDSPISLEALYEWFKANNLADRLPNPNEFKVQQLKDALAKAKSNIDHYKSGMREYNDMNEFDFGRSQYSVTNLYKDTTKAYDTYIEKLLSLDEDIAKVQSEEVKDLDFMIDIEELDLSNSDITELPKDFVLLDGLKKVNVSNTKLSSIDLEFSSYTPPSFDISGTAIAIKEGMKLSISNFDQNTEIDAIMLGRYSHIAQRFIADESDPVAKVKLAQKYCIKRVVIDPTTLSDEFFDLDTTHIDIIDMYKTPLSYEAFGKLRELRLNNTNTEFVYAYDTTWGQLKERIISDLDEDDAKEFMDELDEAYDSEAPDDKMLTVLSYMDFQNGYLEVECSDDKASIIVNTAIKSDHEKVHVMTSEESWCVDIRDEDVEVYAGSHEWSYEYTDTNDGALEQYRANCSAELDGIRLGDAVRFKIGEIDGEEIVDEYGLDYDREDEGVYY
jgi:hypothetical protein